ncbi:type I-C CRISPR-associated protein Cas5c [Enterocloster bolteae]|uniref:type I-C CRISPR-associated protein Cas5c n=1 Tax=Enterocloster bolteae TaxID=208479 RepID=UPI0028DB85BE|nr:type I-C CRISPR-associated protein Cas5c [Enterocloster bolteae]
MSDKKIVPSQGRDMPKICYEVRGEYALFTNPMTKTGGDLHSYPVPTCSAVTGLTESIYWKPSIKWKPLRIRILNPIRYQSRSKLLPVYKTGGKDLGYYSYLRDVCYQIEVELAWGSERYASDRNVAKHYESMLRWLRRGGKLPVHLGITECFAYVRPCLFGDGEGYYDAVDMDFGVMVHSRDFEKGVIRLAPYRMHQGVICFPDQEECITRTCRAGGD